MVAGDHHPAGNHRDAARAGRCVPEEETRSNEAALIRTCWRRRAGLERIRVRGPSQICGIGRAVLKANALIIDREFHTITLASDLTHEAIENDLPAIARVRVPILPGDRGVADG